VRMTGIAKGTVAKLAVEIYFQTDPLPNKEEAHAP